MLPFNENLNQENLFEPKKPEYPNNDKKLAPEGSTLELIRKTPEGLLYSMLPNTHQVIEEIAKHKEITNVQAVLAYHLTDALVHSPYFLVDRDLPYNAIHFFDINDISGKSSNQINEAAPTTIEDDDREYSVVPMKTSFDNEKNVFAVEIVWKDHEWKRDSKIRFGCSVFVDSQGKVIIKSGSDSNGFEALVISNEVIPEENGYIDYGGKTRVISSGEYTAKDVLKVNDLLGVLFPCRERFFHLDTEQERKMADNRIRNRIRRSGSTHRKLEDNFFTNLIVGAIDKEDYFKEIIERDSARLLASKYSIFALSKKNQTVTAEEVKIFFDSNKELSSQRPPIVHRGYEEDDGIHKLVYFSINGSNSLTDLVKDGADPFSWGGGRFYRLINRVKMKVEEFEKLKTIYGFIDERLGGY